MDEFRRGLLLQMGANRDRTRRRREPWLYGVSALPVAAALVWLTGARLLPAGVLLAGWGLTVFRRSRLNGQERQRLLGQTLVLAGIAVAAAGVWRILP